MANVVVSAIATFNGKALTKGKKQLTDFEKTTQKLGKTFTKVFAGVAFVAFAKNAVNAFVESEKAAAKLRTTVKNLGLEFEQPGIDKYLQGLSLQFGIIDENLIPGFQRLLIATKNVSKAQSLFETALNVSAGTGKDLNTVTTSLSKAYMGDSVALGRLGVGLSKAQLKSASFLDIQRTLNANFAGQAAAAVEGYAGDMAKLTVAVDESKEAIGKGLLDALKALSGDTSIDTFTTKMVKSAETIGNAFGSVIDFLQLLNPNAAVKVDGKFVRKSGVRPQANARLGERDSLNTTKKIVKARKDELSIITAGNKTKTEVDKLAEKFDVERIGLMKALGEATDAETKLRIQAKIAILDNNEAMAKKILAEMNGVKAVDILSESMTNAAAAILTAGQKVLLGLGVSPSQMSGSTITGTGGFPDVSNLANTSLNNPSFGTSAEARALGLALGFTPQEVVITFDPTSGGDRLSQAIAESIQIATKNGFTTVPAGQGF